MPKPICASCAYYNKVCGIGMKNTYNDCKKFKTIEISQLIAEKNRLQVSGEDPERLDYLKKKIDYFDYGIK